MTLISTLVLPILQSIIASRMDSAMDEWAKHDGDSNEGRFCKIMKQTFIAAVKKVKGDSPKVLKEHVDELFDECCDAILEEIQTMQPAKIKAYIDVELYNAFKEELEKNSDAIPYINETLLKAILQQSKVFEDKLQVLCEKVSEMQNTTESILGITQKLMGGKGLSVCKIVPYTDKTPIVLPTICSERCTLVDELESLLTTKKSLVLYAGVQEGKTVASRLLANRFRSEYQVIEIDLAYHNELNLEYVIHSYDDSDKYLFVLDGVRYDSNQYEAFCTLITRLAQDNRLFIVNCYDRISDQILDDAVMLTEKELPPLTKEDVQNMIPQTCDEALVDVVFGLSQGQPFLTNAICSFLKTKGWKLTGDEMGTLFTFSHGDSLKKKVRLLLSRTVNDSNAYSLLNRLMVINGSFSEIQCAELANINPILSSPYLLLNKLLGTWVIEENGKYRLSSLLRKTIEPDLLPQEMKDCYNLEADRYLQKQNLTPSDVLVVLNCLVRAGEVDKAGAFYVLMLMKLRDSHLLDVEGVSLLKAIWIGVPLPSSMSVQFQLVVRCTQLIVLTDLNEQNVDGILDELSLLLDKDGIDKELRSTSIQSIAAFCILRGRGKLAIQYQQKWLASSDDESLFNAKEMALVSLGKVATQEDLYEWLPLYADLDYPQDEMFSQGALAKINKIFDGAEESDREVALRDILTHTLSAKANIFAVACAARLIDYLWQSDRAEEARTVYHEMSEYLSSDLGEILLNYSFGLGLYHHGLSDEAYPYMEKAAHGKHIEKACMMALNARSSYAQILGDKGDRAGAVAVIREVVEHPDFCKIYSSWEQDAALCTLAYTLWENGQHEEAVSYLLKVEHHLWSVRDNADADYINLSIRFVVLVMHVYAHCFNKTIDKKYAVPDYCLFTKTVPKLDQIYKPERNFTKERMLYELAERYACEDAALTVIEHMMDFQREDAAAYARLLSVMVQAVPLCLEKGRKDIVEYIILTVLSAPKVNEVEREIDYEHLVLTNSLLSIVSYRAKCLLSGCSFDDEWLWDLIERSLGNLEDSSGAKFMMDQMKSPNPDYDGIKNVMRRAVVLVFHFRSVGFTSQIRLLWEVGSALDLLCTMSSAQRFLKEFVLDYAMFLVMEYPAKFSISPQKAEALFSKVSKFERTEYMKKIIQGLYYSVKGDIDVSEGMSKFLLEID